MRYFITALIFLYGGLAQSNTVQAMDQEPSCTDVNNAYIAGRSTNRFSFKQFGITQTGQTKFLREAKLNGAWAIQREADTNIWYETDIGWTLDGDTYTKFSSCSKSSVKHKKGEKAYNFIWKSMPYEGKGTMWISRDGKMAKMRRERVSEKWFAPTAIVEDFYDYDQVNAFIPDRCTRGCRAISGSILP